MECYDSRTLGAREVNGCEVRVLSRVDSCPLSFHRERKKEKRSDKMMRKMKEKMMNMKAYQKMVEGKSVKRSELPRIVEKRLDGFLATGLVEQTRRGYYKKVRQDPAWVEAAKTVVTPEDIEDEALVREEYDRKELVEPVAAEPTQTIWDEARLQTGQKAVNIVQIVDGLLSGELGLAALNELKGEAIGILGDLGLIQPAQEGE